MEVEQELLYLKQELKFLGRQVDTIGNRSTALETSYMHQHDVLEKIETQVGEIAKSLTTIETKISGYSGANEAKYRYISMGLIVLGIIATLTANDIWWNKYILVFLHKYLGFNL
jgi:predicted  nucleic acid-binding Zn-ribbon protein